MNATRAGAAASKAYLFQRLALGALALLVGAWVVTHYRWVEEEVDEPPHGAATDRLYALRQVLQAVGTTVDQRTSLEPMPPAGSTLVLASSLWDIFPERDARLHAWVENGGHLVVQQQTYRNDSLRWVPLGFGQPTPPTANGARAGSEPAASGPDGRRERVRNPHRPDADQDFDAGRITPPCIDLSETAATTQPAFVPGQPYRACAFLGNVHPLHHAVPVWQLSGRDGTPAMRVQVGRGSVTAVSPKLVLDNLGLRRGDNARIAAAVLQAAPGRAVAILVAESREPLAGWLWHEARTPTLLTLATIVLGLWRLMVRFGPREAVPPPARRSMGEQVRGTGRFVAGLDARALHAATRAAFEDAARRRVERWTSLDDAARVPALAAAVAHAHAIDQPALLASLDIGGGATPAQVLAATTVLEQVRRALLRTPPAPSAS